MTMQAGGPGEHARITAAGDKRPLETVPDSPDQQPP